MTERFFSKQHMWVQFVGGNTALIGVTRTMVERWKSPVCINLCDEGDVLRTGDVAGDIEFFKGVVDLISPLSGTVDTVHDALIENPQLLGVNPDLYLFTLRDVRRDKPLLTAEEYARYVRREGKA
ncbi:MAG: glycine cleavage system protein H [Clostridia bacterium]|nr:glycine cleavage system protein H [Clostridia bacterium]